MTSRIASPTKRMVLGGTAGVLAVALGVTVANPAVSDTAALASVTTQAIAQTDSNLAQAVVQAQAAADAAAAQAAAEAEAARLAAIAAEEARVAEQAGGIVTLAKAQVGDSYRMGASGPDVFDCSGLTMWLYQEQFGIDLPHNTRAQWNAVDSWYAGERAPQPGDLVFFFDGVDHVGIYIGDGMMVSAENPRSGVRMASITDGYWANHLTGFGRVL